MCEPVGLGVFYGFIGMLRAEGLSIGTDQVQTYLRALDAISLHRRTEVFWAGRATLCRKSADFAAYDRAFQMWFSVEMPTVTAVPEVKIYGVPDGGSSPEVESEDEQLITRASEKEELKHRDVALMSSEEKRLLAAAFSGLPIRAPLRKSRYLRTHRHKRIDPVETMRHQLKRAGEPGPLHYRHRTKRPRKIVLVVDVSGSMKNYAESFLRFGHRFISTLGASTEVFSLGTRLTRVTAALRHPNPDVALTEAGLVVPDWSGGTRLGESLQAFVRLWGQHAMLRGAIVVIASDGWERGDPAVLAGQMSRIHGLAHCVIWANPHRGKVGYEPIQSGVKAILPYVDAMVGGHTLESFRNLADRIADA